MECPVCNTQNGDDSNFCVGCGTPLVFLCLQCRCRADTGDKYCRECGHRLVLVSDTKIIESKKTAVPSKIQTKQPVVTDSISERRTVTVLFADVSGFTSMSEKLDPEEVTTIMNNCLQMMGDTVTAYEGYIDKFIGDCIMALFGAPTAHENDPELAVRAAIDMMKKIEDYNKTLPLKLEKPLGLHIGINTGLVVAGQIGSDARMDYTVMGDTVNLASRLESSATKGHIFISSYTYHQVKNLFEFIEQEPITVKGKAEPVAVYEVIRALDVSEVKNTVTSDIPLVGRIKEIEALSVSVERLQKGEGQTIFLISDPGFGKSRIQSEVKNKFKQKNTQIIEGRCQSYGKNTAYHTFIDIFKRVLGIDSDDTKETVSSKLSIGISLLIGEDKDRLSDEAKSAITLIARLFDIDLSSQLGVSFSEMSAQEIHTATIRAIGWFFAAISRQKATILSIEDLHNADNSTIEVISTLISVSKNHSVMLLLMVRPEKSSPAYKLLPLARRILGDRAVEMTFERLSRNECEAFVGFALGSHEIPRELMELIGMRSDGNPLFLQEIVRSLLEQNVIEQQNGKITVKKELSKVTIPNSITGLVIARFDQLSHLQKEILSRAAVFGPSFSQKLIEATVKDPGLNNALEELINSEMIFESQSFPDVEYSFHTTFIQEAIYDTLLLKRRQALHLEAAETIKEVYKERLQDYVEQLAEHYLKGGDYDNAYSFLVQSAYKAKGVYSNESAARFFEKAIEIAPNIKEQNPSVESLFEPYSEILELLGNMEGAISAWEHIKQNAADSTKKADAMRNIGRIEEKRGNKERSEKIYEEALKLISDNKDSIEYAKLLMNLSWVQNRYRQTDEAIKNASAALSILEKTENKELIALCCNNLAVFYEGQKEFDTALSYNEKSLALFEEAKNKRQIANLELSLGYLKTKITKNEEALKHFSRSAELMNQIGSKLGSAAALLAKGRLYADIGKYDEAVIALSAALSDFRDMEAKRKEAATIISLVQVLIEQKNLQAGYDYINEGLELTDTDDFLSERGKLYKLYGRGLKSEHKAAEAKEYYEKAVEIFEKLGRKNDAEDAKKEGSGV